MKIVHDSSKCIGCGSCTALCPKYFEIGEDGKASLKGAETNQKNGQQELEVQEIGCAQEAADICPIQIIRVVRKK